jgi:hypothetical protein
MTVNTLTHAPLVAYRELGRSEARIESKVGKVLGILDRLETLGIPFNEMALRLEWEGVKKLQDVCQQLIYAPGWVCLE